MRGPRAVWVDGTPYRLTSFGAAQLEVLAMIRAEPGLHPGQIAQRRGTTGPAARRAVLILEKHGLIRTERALTGDTGAPRRCYPVEPA